MIDDTLRAARLAAARADKALRAAENLERRTRSGPARASHLIAEAQQLRALAATHHAAAERHLDTARWLRSPQPPANSR